MTLLSSIRRPSAPAAIATLGLLWVLVSTLDPLRPAGSLGGPLLCLLALALRVRRGLPCRPYVFACTLAVSLALGVFAKPEFRRGDFRPYYAFLRSAAFDHDLEFTNEFRAWGLPLQSLTPTGYRRNQHTPGPALVWSPFFAAAHVYVVASGTLGLSRWAADGNSPPYLRSALAGSVTAVVVGLWLLVALLERRLPRRAAVVAAVAAVATSPMLVYTFAEPGMAHAACFGLACAALWALDRAERQPSLAAWALLGGLLGLMALMRVQAVVFWLVAVPLASAGLLKRTVRPTWLLAAAVAGFLALTPQFVAWKILYGRWVTVGSDLGRWAEDTGRPIAGEVLFRPDASLDLSAPYLGYVLFSTDRGLFNWTPGIFLGLAAFLLGLRRWGWIGLGGVLVLVGTAWLNGSFRLWWNAGDAFGARRFDIVVPFVAFGYASVILFLERRPFLAPTLLLLSLAVWNMGLAHLWRTSAVNDTAPLKDVAALQIGQLQRELELALDRLSGSSSRAWIYNYFVGRLFFTNAAHDGVIDLGSPTQPFLTGGWSPPINEAGPPSYRLGLYPRACVRIPLLRPVDLQARITARAPTPQRDRVARVTLNDRPLAHAAWGGEWTERIVPLPATAMVPGENLLCLEFDDFVSGADGARIGAHIKRIVVH